MGSVGQDGNFPVMDWISCNDSYATVTSLNYLAGAIHQGYQFQPTHEVHVCYQNNALGIFSVTLNSTGIQLVPLTYGGEVPAVTQGQSLMGVGSTLTAVSQFTDHSSNISIDWNNRDLKDSVGNTVLAWNLQRAYTSLGVLSVDWNAATLLGPGGSLATVAWGNTSALYDNSGFLTVGWNSHILQTQVSSSVTTVLNWGTGILSDTAAGDKSVDWTNRELFASNGSTVQLNWATAGTLSSSALLALSSGLSLTKQANVTQITSIVTGVTSNGCAGQITTVSATTASASTSTFTVTNSSCLTTSYVQLQLVSYAGTYYTNGVPLLTVSAIGSGSFNVTIANAGVNALSGVLVFNYTIS